MQAIYFAPRFPLPVTGGDRLLTERYLRHLGERWKIHFLSFADRDSQDPALADELKRTCNLASLVTFPLGSMRIPAAIRGAARSWPLQAGYYYRPEVARRLRELVSRIRPDVVIFQTVRLLPYLDDLPADTRSVIHFVDALSENYRRSAAVTRSFPQRLLYLHESRRLGQAERQAVRRADATYAVSEQDAEYLNRLSDHPRPPVQVVPIGIDAAYYRPRPLPPEPRGRIAFLGRMSTRANADASVWFAREVLPRLQQRLDRQIHFTIVGAEPARRVRDLESSAVTVTGRVPDIRPFLWDSDLSVAPMRIATGIQNKILLSLALGRPAVASSACMNGIGRGKAGVLVADGVEETIERIADCYTEYQTLRLAMPAASAAIIDSFSWRANLADFAESVERLLTARSPAQLAQALP